VAFDMAIRLLLLTDWRGINVAGYSQEHSSHGNELFMRETFDLGVLIRLIVYGTDFNRGH